AHGDDDRPPCQMEYDTLAESPHIRHQRTMSALQAIVIAVLQGATELFPVSSLGHAVVLPALLHWPLDQRSPEFLPFLVMLHLGTATELLIFFWRDCWSMATGVLCMTTPRHELVHRRVLL